MALNKLENNLQALESDTPNNPKARNLVEVNSVLHLQDSFIRSLIM